jgi:hypothetical protein
MHPMCVLIVQSAQELRRLSFKGQGVETSRSIEGVRVASRDDSRNQDSRDNGWKDGNLKAFH